MERRLIGGRTGSVGASQQASERGEHAIRWSYEEVLGDGTVGGEAESSRLLVATEIALALLHPPWNDSLSHSMISHPSTRKSTTPTPATLTCTSNAHPRARSSSRSSDSGPESARGSNRRRRTAYRLGSAAKITSRSISSIRRSCNPESSVATAARAL